jgi:glycosyltransferase involved in cell wall biosynthesis
MSGHALRVALVGPTPPPAGGMAMQTEQLARLLGEEGVAVTTVAVNPPYRPAWVANVRGLRAAARLLAYVPALWRAAGRADLVHVMANSGWSWHLFAAPAVWIARLRGVPAVVNYRGGEAEQFLQRSSRVVRATMRRAAALVVPSRFLHDVFARFGMPSEIVPNIVDLARFAPRAAVAVEPGLIVVARNLEPIYDIGTAIEALAAIRRSVPAARLVIAGTGPERERLAARAAQLGLAGAVEFTGRLDRDAIAALYRRAALMLNPTRVDNMPNSLLEAMASGLPIVSTDAGGVPFVVRDGHSALLVPLGNPEAMARAAARVLSQPDVAADLARAALADVQQYAWSAVRPRWLDLYARARRGACGVQELA